MNVMPYKDSRAKLCLSISYTELSTLKSRNNIVARIEQTHCGPWLRLQQIPDKPSTPTPMYATMPTPTTSCTTALGNQSSWKIPDLQEGPTSLFLHSYTNSQHAQGQCSCNLFFVKRLSRVFSLFETIKNQGPLLETGKIPNEL